jgi:hypothetical protein
LTGEEFSSALQKGQISAKAVEVALTRLTEKGGKYANGAIAQSDTLFGKLSTLQDAIQRFGQNIGKFLSPIFERIIDFLTTITNKINNLFGKIERAAAINKQARKNLGLPEGGRLTGQQEAAVRTERARLFESGFGLSAPDTPKDVDMSIPKLLGGTANGEGRGAKPLKERVDMSQKLYELSKRLRAEEEAGNERAIATLQHMVRMQQIRESDYLTVEKQDKLEESIHQFRQDIFAIDKGIADQRDKMHEDAQRQFNEFFKAEQEAAQKRLEADPGYQMRQQLEEMLKLQNQVAAGATAIGNAFSNAFRDVITGSKSANEALADMMSAVAEHFMDMAAQIIAQQLAMILYGTIMKALGVSMPSATGGGGPLPSAEMFTGGFKLAPFAEGGFVDRPTNALIGEGGEPEYVIPESKMRESMARYSRGSRGASVIPEGSGGAADENGGTAVAAPIDVRYTVERINSVDYVTADQFQRGMQSAATQGAKQGEQNTLKRLQMSSSTRKRLGM